ncbi:heat shock protein HtpX [Caldalkalibacillus uzonensis]|uniref:Heat shock protein HtpX n=1 Tax=Caldalkalibacillus uzonensis TaxID=353224 RepID=A0ABU0CLV4_9BACI|nr:zinc metalloprotease HtpX [Caldalkalibacillus uzonensis]MDQ0337394.1 heat shock protein HtpX [Caldalkalibacillus uzonensis]
MYVADFVRTLIEKRNVGAGIYLILNILLVIFLFGGFDHPQGIVTGLFIYALSLTIALSPVGEWVLRKQLGCKPLVRREHIERLQPLFEEVKERARALDPSIPQDVKLFISNDNEPNAFATGRKTICVTKGFLQYSDEQIKATLAHEFGHLSKKDTDLILFISVGNLIVATIFVIYRIIFYIIGFMAGAVYRSLAPIIITIFVDLILVGLIWIWTKIGTLLVMHSNRQNEYFADDFARRCGYGEHLISVLDSLSQHDQSSGKGLWANLAASHPDADQRIARLEKVVAANV